MNNNKAFTLIELIAVVIVIGLLSTLIIPKVKTTIDDSKKSSAELSAQSLLRNTTNYYLEKRAQNNFNECTYDFTNETNTCDDFEFMGDAPTSGSITINKYGEITGSVTFNKKYEYCINNNEVTEGNC